ncbi:TIGR03960 family B12-binding radical SAM protein [Thermovenabulum sp.]|uniref:TIGR03960 family B12-binding radical SAM protein n=1 Tax=Thermovenabulum sp. TaxID=3100335 RepID=UPI003C7B6DAF
MNLEKTLDRILLRVSKPTRYTGNELNSVKKVEGEFKVRVALAFPDVYEVGMSHLGLRILYHLLNEREDVFAERVFAPWVDFEEQMRKEKIPLFSLESKTPLKKFDFIGFSLQYEMSYSNILNMLELSGIPIKSRDRKDKDPLIMAGGPCAFNPEPLSDIIDFFVIGEAEEVIHEIIDLYVYSRNKNNFNRMDFLLKLAQIEGIYVPSLYEPVYNENGTLKEIKPLYKNLPAKIKKRVVKDLDKAYYPTKIIVPYMDIVHDRAVLEIFRGCTRGCRFCQAGMIYRPVREKNVKTLHNLAKRIIENTGYEEVSLASLSTSDYSSLRELVEILTDEFRNCAVGLSLPSLRIDSFTIDIAKKIQEIKKTGLTFAPEAGTQRLRNVINKGVTEEDLLCSVRGAFLAGWNNVKLYFMIGLPTETYEDLAGIADLAKGVIREYREIKGNTKGVQVTVSTSVFVPKPFTPFQWESQIPLQEVENRQNFLKKNLKGLGINYNWHDSKLSYLEAVFSRGDRKLGEVLIKAHKKGCKFDGWNELFSFEKWMEAFKEANIDPDFYALREREEKECFPWEIIDPGIDREFLWEERKKSFRGEVTPDCRFNRCNNCGILKLRKGINCGI